VFDNTPPSGGSLSHTDSPNPGDRIAAALSSLRRTPPPGWLWALWVSSLPAGRRDPLAGAVPTDAAVIPVGEGEGFDTSPPHYGIVPRGALPSYGHDGATAPEVFAGHLVRMFATGSAPDVCMCAACIPTGTPRGLVEYLAEEVAAEAEWPSDAETAPDPGRFVRFTVALEVAAARAMREHYIHALNGGLAPADWHAQAMDPTYPGHYIARMSDTGLAVGVCSVMWSPRGLCHGWPHLYPVELYAALCEGFSYPVPSPYSHEWHAQAAAEQRLDGGFSFDLLRNTAEDLAGILEDGRSPWEGITSRRPEVNP
jgi:hypothetical protein